MHPEKSLSPWKCCQNCKNIQAKYAKMHENINSKQIQRLTERYAPVIQK